MPDPVDLAPAALIESRILLVRAQKVLLDSDLAALYQVETKALNRAVKRNRDRFPEDFTFQLTVEEAEQALRYQIGASNEGRGGRRLDDLEWRQSEQGRQIQAVFETIQQLIEAPTDSGRKRIGFPTATAE
jgi:hypothetical protein